jgi:flagellar basal body-associated protein FliL
MEPNNQFQGMDNGMNNSPISANNPASTPIESKKKVGPIVVVLAIVLILIIGALYLFASNMGSNTNSPAETVEPITNTSDEVTDIDADLNSAIEGIDAQTF